MRNIDIFYENTKEAHQHKNIEKLISIEPKAGNAVDLGCGAGRDTIYLIKNNWNVVAVDIEDTSDLIISKLNESEKKRFKFICGNFEDIEFGNNDLVVANFSLPFGNRENFKELWEKIKSSIKVNGYFVGNFFRIKGFLD